MSRFLVPLVVVVVFFVILPWVPFARVDLESSGTWLAIAAAALLLCYFFLIVPWLSRRPLRNLTSKLAGEYPSSFVAPVAIDAHVKGMSVKAVVVADRRGVLVVRLRGMIEEWTPWDSISEIKMEHGGLASDSFVNVLLSDRSIVIAPVRGGPFQRMPESGVELFANNLRQARNLDPASTQTAG